MTGFYLYQLILLAELACLQREEQEGDPQVSLCRECNARHPKRKERLHKKRKLHN